MVRGDSSRMVRKDSFACTRGQSRTPSGSRFARDGQLLSSSGLVKKPEDSSGRTDSSGGILTKFGFGFAAKSGKNLAFIFAGRKEESVASTIKDDRRERQAV